MLCHSDHFFVPSSADLWTTRSSPWFYLPPAPMQAGRGFRWPPKGVVLSRISLAKDWFRILKLRWPLEILQENFEVTCEHPKEDVQMKGTFNPKKSKNGQTFLGSWMDFFHQPSSLEYHHLFVRPMYRLSEPWNLKLEPRAKDDTTTTEFVVFLSSMVSCFPKLLSPSTPLDQALPQNPRGVVGWWMLSWDDAIYLGNNAKLEGNSEKFKLTTGGDKGRHTTVRTLHPLFFIWY